MRRSALAIVMTIAIACSPATGPAPDPIPPSKTPTALIGDWSWDRSCHVVVGALRAAGLEDELRTRLVEARYFPREDLVGPRPCRGAEETRYVYFFELDRRWGVLDDDDVLVEDRRFAIVDADTIAFATIRVDHHLGVDGTLTFEVRPPARCEGACRDDYAWAVATFAGGTFRRVS